ncbi:ferredoxin [Alcaligenaceae bacterium]|nr:ferredoxin [Alcaligenaceae bacterium]
MKILVHEEKCCGAGLCVMNAPQVFDQREEDGIVVLLTDNPPQDELENVRRACRICPAAAIELQE